MQILKHQIARQQGILHYLGYYKGKIDGIWSIASIEAKRAFELDSSFNPGVPNNGLPFPNTGPYPSGIHKDISNPRLLSLTGFDPSKYEVEDKELVMSTVDAQQLGSNGSSEPSGPYTDSESIMGKPVVEDKDSYSTVETSKPDVSTPNTTNSSDSAESDSKASETPDTSQSKAVDATVEAPSGGKSEQNTSSNTANLDRKKRKFDNKQQNSQHPNRNRR